MYPLCPWQGQWYMFIEELGQFYQLIAPVPPWFHYLLRSQEVDGSVGVTLDILLALLYIILKVRSENIRLHAGL